VVVISSTSQGGSSGAHAGFRVAPGAYSIAKAVFEREKANRTKIDKMTVFILKTGPVFIFLSILFDTIFIFLSAKIFIC
jgi:hypothetical protein